MKQYVCDLYLHDKPDGPSIGMGKEVAVVLYTDAVKMQREAYVAGVLAPVGGIAWDDEAMKKRKRWAEAEASRRYKEEL
jgi:hypothetical protein